MKHERAVPRSRGLTKLELSAYADLGLDPERVTITDLDAEVAKFLEADDARLANEFPVDPTTPPLNFDESRDATPIEKLSPEQRQELAQKYQKLGEIERELAEVKRKSAGLPPSVAAAVALAESPVATKSTAAAAKAAVTDIPAPAPAPAPAENGGEANSSAFGDVRECPRCGWNVDDPNVSEPSAVDKQLWLASLQGSRFVKEYSLYDDTIRVTFRSLKTSEISMSLSQAHADKLGSAALFFSRVIDYQHALSLARIEFANGVVIVSPIDQILASPKDDDELTRLPALLKHVNDEIHPNESLGRIVDIEFRKFRRLTEYMEANANRSGFTTGIGGRG